MGPLPSAHELGRKRVRRTSTAAAAAGRAGEGPPPPPPQARAGSGPSRPRSRRRGPGPCRPGLVGPPGLILPVTQFSWARSLVLKYLGRPGRAGDSASAKSGQPGPGHHIFLLESAIFVFSNYKQQYLLSLFIIVFIILISIVDLFDFGGPGPAGPHSICVL